MAFIAFAVLEKRYGHMWTGKRIDFQKPCPIRAGRIFSNDALYGVRNASFSEPALYEVEKQGTFSNHILYKWETGGTLRNYTHGQKN